MSEQLVQLQVTGLDELQAKLQKQAPAVIRKVLRTGVEAGGEVMRAEVEANARRLTGFLAEHIVMKITSSEGGSRATAIIGAQADVGYAPIEQRSSNISLDTSSAHFPAVYDIFLEFGSKHQPATPFFGPAFEASAGDALDVLAETIWKGLQELAE
jgi:HK97 gp10 family phage protein